MLQHQPIYCHLEMTPELLTKSGLALVTEVRFMRLVWSVLRKLSISSSSLVLAS